MEESTVKRKRIQFGSVTVHHVPAISNSHDSFLIDSQVVSADLLSSVHRAVPFLAALDHNACTAATHITRKRSGHPLLLIGGEEEVVEAETVHFIESTAAHAQTQLSGRSSSSFGSTQQPRLSLYHGTAIPMGTQCSSPHTLSPVTVEDTVESSIADSEDEDDVCAVHHSGPAMPRVTSVEGTSAAARATLPMAPPCVCSPQRQHNDSPTLSQLDSAVDDVLGTPPSLAWITAVPETSLHVTVEMTATPPVETRGTMPQSFPPPSIEKHMAEIDKLPCEIASGAATAVKASAPDVVDAANDGSCCAPSPHSPPPADSPAPSSTTQLVSEAEKDRMPAQAPQCVFCARSREAQRHRGSAPPLLRSERHSFHLACALWCPEVYVDPSTQAVRGIAAAAWRARHIKCALCRQPGAAVGCAKSTCQLSFHLPCAVKARAAMAKERFVLHCPAHGSGGEGCEVPLPEKDSAEPCETRMRLQH